MEYYEKLMKFKGDHEVGDGDATEAAAWEVLEVAGANLQQIKRLEAREKIAAMDAINNATDVISHAILNSRNPVRSFQMSWTPSDEPFTGIEEDEDDVKTYDGVKL